MLVVKWADVKVELLDILKADLLVELLVEK